MPAQIDIPPTRFAFFPGNAIVLEVLLKHREAEIVAERRAQTIVAVVKRLGLVGFVMDGREALEAVVGSRRRFVPEAVRVADPLGIGCCLEQVRCGEQTSVVRLIMMPLIARRLYTTLQQYILFL
jgi:hypothetical protein